MADERCPRCDRDRSGCRALDIAESGQAFWNIEEFLGTAADDCHAHAVDWRQRALDNDALAQDLSKDKANLTAALADRDQRIAALKMAMSLPPLPATVMATAQVPLGPLARLGAIADALPLDEEADADIGRAIAEQSAEARRSLGRAAIEAEVVEQVAVWLESILATATPMSPIGYNAGAIDMANRVIRDLRSGAWRSK